MKYVPPLGSADPNAAYADPVEGTIPAAAVEQPLREIASVIASMGLVPSETDLTQLDQAIDLKVAAVRPELSELQSSLQSRMDALDSRMDALAVSLEHLAACEKYDLCEFYYFRNPVLKPGFMPAQGDLLENAAHLYPDAWAFLHTPEGQQLCLTEEAWQTGSNAVWATLGNGTRLGWNGIGGVPFYAPDPATGSLRLPDLRGMYAEAAGFDGLNPGDVHGDAIRPITASFMSITLSADGAVVSTESPPTGYDVAPGAHGVFWKVLDSSRVAPAANKNQPRAWGALACVYLGRPAV